jgi:hypothetical protein
LGDDEETILKLDEIDQMNKQPSQPREQSRKTPSANISHGFGSSYNRHAATIMVLKRGRCLTP